MSDDQNSTRPQPVPEPTPAGDIPKDAKTWAMLSHLAALAGYVGIPFGNIIGPLVVWLMKKGEHPFIDEQGKESLNFQITVMIAALACIPLVFLCVGVPMLIGVAIANLVFIVIAMIQASEGKSYRYPVSIRFIK